MCSQYWNLNTQITCPHCNKTDVWNLQTHFMGDFGSCINEYSLGEKVAELGDMSVTLDGKLDSFIGECESCEKFFDFGAKIVKGKVMTVWQLEDSASPSLTRETVSPQVK